MTAPNRAQIRRELALAGDTGKKALAGALTELATAGPLAGPEVIELLSAYLFDPQAGALLAISDARETWLDGPLFTWLGPGNAAPLDDQIAALVVAPALGKGTVLAPIVTRYRFAPRADDAVALAIAALDLPAQASALEALFADRGPDPDLLALSIVQCGRVLAWAPHLLEWPIAEPIVEALLARLVPSQPRALVDAIAHALGPIAAHPGPLATRVRAAAVKGLDLPVAAKPTSFLAQVEAISKPRAMPDADYWKSLAHREVAAACAYILGYAAPIDREEFLVHRGNVLGRPDSGALMLPFVEGLIASGHVPAVTELALSLLGGEDREVATALGLAAELPLDMIADELVAQLDAPHAARRAQAVQAVELLANAEAVDIDAAIAMRLGDPSPDVAAAAVRALRARDRRDLLAAHGARDPHPVRRAIIAAGLGELGVSVIGELARGTLDDLEQVDATAATERDARGDASPLIALLGDALLSSIAGFETACDLIGGVPDAAGMIALAAARHSDRDIGILAPPQARTHLAHVTVPIAEQSTDTELASLALYLLARFSAGDELIAEVVSDAVADTADLAANLLSALGELRVATDRTSAAIAPFLAPESPIGARVAAAAISGRALRADHPAWAHVRELLELGTIARTAAWTAFRDRARRRPIDPP